MMRRKRCRATLNDGRTLLEVHQLPTARRAAPHGLSSRVAGWSKSGWALLRAEQAVRARHGAPVCNVLLVEDEESNANYALEALTLLNCRVRHACTGREAVDFARDERFDLILMDYRLPELNGLQAVHQIRLREACCAAPRAPVVMVTASVMCAEVDRYFSAGVNDVLVKPFSLSQLAGMVDRWCVSLDEPAQAVC